MLRKNTPLIKTFTCSGGELLEANFTNTEHRTSQLGDYAKQAGGLTEWE